MLTIYTTIISTQWHKILEILSFEYIYSSLINFMVSLAFSYLHEHIMMGIRLYHTVRGYILAELITGVTLPQAILLHYRTVLSSLGDSRSVL